MMAQKEQITFMIDTEGNIKMDYKGKTGKSCIGATEEIEVLLGTVTNKERTADYYKPDPERKVYETR